jgi:hypothetical protein
MFREKVVKSFKFRLGLFLSLAIFIILIFSVFNISHSQSLEYLNSEFWSYVDDVDIRGNYTFCAFYNGLVILDISDPDSIEYVSKIYLQGGARYLFVEGDYVYVSDGLRDLQIIDISDIQNPFVAQTISDSIQANGLYIQNDYCYLADNSRKIAIYNVADPVNPIFVADLEVGFSSPEHVVARGNYAAVSTDDGGTLHIVNITDPANPYVEANCSNFHAIIGIFMDENYVYLATSDTFGSRFDIVDYSNPSAPYIIGSIDPGLYGFFAEVYVRGNYAYTTLGYDGLGVINVVDKQNPFIDTNIVIQGATYRIDIDNDVVMTSDRFSYLQALDLFNPTIPVPRGSYLASKTIDRVYAIDDYLYLVSEYKMLVADNSNRIYPTLVDSIDFPNTIFYDLFRSGNFIYTIGYTSGLLIYDITNPIQPIYSGYLLIPSVPRDLFVNSNYAYVTTSEYGLRIIDIGDPSNPTQVGFYDGHSDIKAVYIQDNYAYLTNFIDGLLIIDISDPGAPNLIGNFNPAIGAYNDVIVNDYYAFLIINQSLNVVNISDPVNPYLMGYADLPYTGHRLMRADNYLFISNFWYGLLVYDISDLANPQLFSVYEPGAQINNFDIVGNYVYLANEYSLLILYFNQQTGAFEPYDIIPSHFSLPQNHPNPFNTSTTIEFSLPEAAHVELSVYNILGQKVAVLFDGQKQAGKHAVTWDAAVAPSGVYFARLKCGSFSETINMLLLK